MFGFIGLGLVAISDLRDSIITGRNTRENRSDYLMCSLCDNGSWRYIGKEAYGHRCHITTLDKFDFDPKHGKIGTDITRDYIGDKVVIDLERRTYGNILLNITRRDTTLCAWDLLHERCGDIVNLHMDDDGYKYYDMLKKPYKDELTMKEYWLYSCQNCSMEARDIKIPIQSEPWITINLDEFGNEVKNNSYEERDKILKEISKRGIDLSRWHNCINSDTHEIEKVYKYKCYMDIESWKRKNFNI